MTTFVYGLCSEAAIELLFRHCVSRLNSVDEQREWFASMLRLVCVFRPQDYLQGHEAQIHFDNLTTILAEEFGRCFEPGLESWSIIRDLGLGRRPWGEVGSGSSSTSSLNVVEGEQPQTAGIDSADTGRNVPVEDDWGGSENEYGGNEDGGNAVKGESGESAKSEGTDVIDELGEFEYWAYALMFVFAMHSFQMTAEEVQEALGEGCDIPFENVPEEDEMVAWLSTPETRKERMSRWPLPAQKVKTVEIHPGEADSKEG